MRLRLNGARGAALLVAGAYCVARGIAYLPLGSKPDVLPRGLEMIASPPFTLETWAGLWVIAGLICLVLAFQPRDAIAWGALTGMMTAWGFAYLIGWGESLAYGRESREWLTATTYLGPAIIIAILSIWHTRRSRAG
ncbi:MAG: hypothetical protein BGO45_10560 [Microbacterium sp. 71-36]|uniref:hypothetical protein n=1 Tax=unclassified Microbacterium TaxID=2609290 RepID=UPI00092CD0D8|nr:MULTISPECIES: hypothetical protein [unclassified Microbacterium]MBN9210707.1 hypothetical protein [Microbacterium sp.]OJV77233.1 MAG: hypothetical protein BGO45_10560 [Microbacterium sp. 71-36]